MKQKVLALAVTGALASLASTGASALEFTAGNWKMDISGSVNAFYTSTNCNKSTSTALTPTGTVVTRTDIVMTLPTCGAQNQDSASIQNGLLPGYINFTASTQAKGLDLKAVIGFWPGTSNSNAAQPVGDQRTNYLEFGAASWGHIKAGRDIGLFAQNAILNDMTLLSVGTGAGFQGAINTTLGMIGTGYIYTEFQPQITYTSPNWNGFNFAAGAFQPRNTAGVGGVTVGEGKFNQPGWQALAQYEYKGTATAKLWTSYAYQQVEANGPIPFGLSGVGLALTPGQRLKGDGWELGGTLGYAGFGAMLVGWWGSGIGESIQFANGHDSLGNQRDSSGYLAQLTYKFGEFQLGASYGQNKLDSTSTDAGLFNPTIGGVTAAAVPNLMNTNKAFVIQGKYDLMPGLSLIAEYVDQKTDSHSGCDAFGFSNGLGGPFVCEQKQQTFAIGGIVFF